MGFLFALVTVGVAYSVHENETDRVVGLRGFDGGAQAPCGIRAQESRMSPNPFSTHDVTQTRSHRGTASHVSLQLFVGKIQERAFDQGQVRVGLRP